jgi:ATP-dependent DNA helicase RecG
MIDTTDLARVAKGPEGQYLERKSLFEGTPNKKKPRDRSVVRDQIAEVTAAFANADGGMLVLGVEDDGTVTGHGYPDSVIADMLLVPERRLEPPGKAGWVGTVDGKSVLVFDVAMAPTAVMVTGNGYPVRQGDSCVKMLAHRIDAWKQAGLVESWEARPSTLTVADLDDVLLNKAISASKDKTDGIAGYLVRRRLADDRAGQLILRRAAELVFASAANQVDHPNAVVRIFRVMGTERKPGANHNIDDLPPIEGSIPQVLEQTFATISPLLRKPKRLRGSTFENAPEYPTYAWQEAIVNAVAHRDYDISGRGVEVWLFDDRMEVESPGSIVDAISLDELRQGRRSHASRNPRLSRVLVDLGYMREQGEGIPRMFGEMTTQFLPLPVVEVRGKTFTVTLRNTPNITPGTAEWLSTIGREGLGENQVHALVLALQHGAVTNAELRDATGVDTLTSSRLLGNLRDRDLLQMRDQGSLTSYVLTRQAREAAEASEPPRATEGPKATGPGQGALFPELEPQTGGFEPQTGGLEPQTGGLEPQTGGFLVGHPELAQRIAEARGKRPNKGRLRALIADMCAVQALRPTELAVLLGRKKPRDLVDQHLSPMVDDGVLQRTHPETPSHPQQAFTRTKLQ